MNSTKTVKRPEIGILQWFHIGEYERVEQTLIELKKLGITHLRTGLSWADFYTEGGKEWYDWLLPKLSKEVEILPCYLYTPPSIGEVAKTSSPPVDLKAYANFLDVLITDYGQYFNYIELWNEPNNRSEWDYTLDPHWHKFAEMIGSAAYWARKRGKKTVLGGMSPVDPGWLKYMGELKLLQHFDAVGFHGFPDVFDYHWEGWEPQVQRVRNVLQTYAPNAEVWLTEAGYSTWQHNEKKQLEEFLKVLDTTAQRAYWYTLFDLSSNYNTVDGFHLDEREYHFGIKHCNGQPKLLYSMWENHGLDRLAKAAQILEPIHLNGYADKPAVVVTGGSGFIGTNMTHHLLEKGERVVVLDNLSRPNVSQNLEWLRKQYGKQLQVIVSDIRNPYAVTQAIDKAKHIYHFAAQVAVTTSVTDPREDFNINLLGTMNLLEAIRKREERPSLLFTSTNKVYGHLESLELLETDTAYIPAEKAARKGLDETTPLEFYSPYGCSKGAADQYVCDYARIYGIEAVVFRMSCIYGPHQFGTEDQGWVAHFLLQALRQQPITLYGTGKQVRDLLYAEDLINAMELTRKNIKKLSGQAFNMGGGADNAVSLVEVIDMIKKLHGTPVDLRFSEWRPGDQQYYVSDTHKFQLATGWKPKVGYREGIERLYHWLLENRSIKKTGDRLPASRTYATKKLKVG